MRLICLVLVSQKQAQAFKIVLLLIKNCQTYIFYYCLRFINKNYDFYYLQNTMALLSNFSKNFLYQLDKLMQNNQKKITQDSDLKRLEKQVAFWKERCSQLEIAYRYAYENIGVNQFLVPLEDIYSASSLQDNVLTLHKSSTKSSDEGSEGSQKKESKTSPTQSNDDKEIQSQIDVSSPFLLQQTQEPSSSLHLIKGCFILQKQYYEQQTTIQYVYPQILQKQTNLFDTISKFIFFDDSIDQFVDDQGQSRKKEIFYGSQYEDFHFVFDKSGQLSLKQENNQFLRQTNLINKNHVYGMVRPEILVEENQEFETEIAFGFISDAPIFTFFKDFNRVLQQQIKLNILNTTKDMSINSRVSIISQILKGITNYSIKNHLKIDNYPMDLKVNTNLCSIGAKYTSLQTYLYHQLCTIDTLIDRFKLSKLIKIIHYILVEKSLIIICHSRKLLNQLFQVLRIIMHPLNWSFPIVYCYSKHYEPFLNSPLPILMGHVKRDYFQQWEDLDNYVLNFLPKNEMIQIVADSGEADLNEVDDKYSKRGKTCLKFIEKQMKQDSVIKTKCVPSIFAKPISSNNLAFKLYYYVKTLLNECNDTKQNGDKFIREMRQTQMLSYYRQNNQNK